MVCQTYGLQAGGLHENDEITKTKETTKTTRTATNKRVECWTSANHGEQGNDLVAQHCDPPYRALGHSYTYRIYVFQGIAGYIPKGGGYRTIMLMF